jgi:Ala-tRNA(Pro) deacylase
MFVSQTVIGYLERSGVDFELVEHAHSGTSLHTAHLAHIDPHKLAKAVLLTHGGQYLLAVIPASGRVDRGALERLFGVPSFELADEEDMTAVFDDCVVGALPVVGPAFGVRTAIDDALLDAEDVYFEAGDREHLVHVKRAQFRRLMGPSPHAAISHRSHAHLHPPKQRHA